MRIKLAPSRIAHELFFLSRKSGGAAGFRHMATFSMAARGVKILLPLEDAQRSARREGDFLIRAFGNVSAKPTFSETRQYRR
jgi:hypothetical protein